MRQGDIINIMRRCNDISYLQSTEIAKAHNVLLGYVWVCIVVLYCAWMGMGIKAVNYAQPQLVFAFVPYLLFDTPRVTFLNSLG